MSTESKSMDAERQKAEEAIVDAALNEVVGGETPSDLLDAILAANEERKIGLATGVASPMRLVAYTAIAAGLLIVAGTFVVPSLMKNRLASLDKREEIASSKEQGAINEASESESAHQANEELRALKVEEESSRSQRTKSNRSQLINDATAKPKTPPVLAHDLSKPFRQGSFDRQVPTFGNPVPEVSNENIESHIDGFNEIQPATATPSQRSGKADGLQIQHKALDRKKIDLAGQQLPSAFYGNDDVDYFAPPKRPRRGLGLEGKKRTSRIQYDTLVENAFVEPNGEQALSTFSIDVDTASYANTRQYLLQSNRMPPPNAVRIEELINYFDYDYESPDPDSEVPFASSMEVAACPWQPKHRLVRIGIKGREVEPEQRPLSNLVFLVDVSGSMNQPNKLPLVVRSLKQLTRRLGENDRVAIVVYASSEGLALESTPGNEPQTILSALDRLAGGGSTAGGAGIQLAYKIAEENFIKGGTNRVLLCTDGDFNVGIFNTEALGELVQTKAKESGVFLSVLGFGQDNLNDRMLEKITNQGNGNYYYLDSISEARKVLVDQMTGTLVTIAKDVKIQVEFNPAKVASYRLIGYENRVMPNQDFNDDTKDAGEIGAGHTVTAFYEVVPVGVTPPGSVDPLKYQPSKADEPSVSATNEVMRRKKQSEELLTLKLRYKQPADDESSKLDFALTDKGESFDKATKEFRFAASVAQFGLLLRNSEHRGSATYESVSKMADASLGEDKHGYREEFLDLVAQAKNLAQARDQTRNE